MTSLRFLLVAILLEAILIRPASAADAPSYSKQIQPLLAKYCLECHNADKTRGDLELQTHKSMIAGGKHGVAIVPGKPDESLLLRLVERKQKPFMPPPKATQPPPAALAVLRAWIAAGAKDDGGTTVVTLPTIKPRHSAAAPISAVAYRPDGRLFAVGTHKQVLLLDSTGAVIGTLPGQTDAVTALAFSRDGQHLAVASGASGSTGVVRLYAAPNGQFSTPERVVPAHSDIIYGLAFSPDGQTLASAGYDRLIKLWEVSSGQALRTLKDHSDTIYGLAFSPDGKLLASAAADRAVKIWDIASGTRLYSLGDATDWLYAIAWSPDGKQVAAAGADKSIRLWEVNAAAGKLVHSIFAHEGTITRLVYTSDGKTLYSLSEDRTIKAWNAGTMSEIKVYAAQPETPLALAVRPDQKQLAVGRYDGALVLLDTATGEARPITFPVDPFPLVAEQEPNDSPSIGQKIALPASIVGSLNRAGDVDCYRFAAKAGQQVGIQVIVAAGIKLEPVLKLTDPTGVVVAESSNGVLGYTCPTAGTYALEIRDSEYRGGGLAYRLHVGDLPIVTGVFPLGLQRGTEADVQLEGVHLGPTPSIHVKAPADAAPGSRLPLTVPTSLGPALGNPFVVMDEFPETTAPALSVPGTANGRITKPAAADTWRFSAKKGQRLIIEVNARRLGSPLDSVIEILDAKGQPMPRAVLRCTARVYTTFRDHDSASPGIRLETWNELAVNDYVLVGNEVLRIRELPRTPDDDCRFFSVAGRRIGFFGTTPTHHNNGASMYKVAIHPPGRTFPPNGLPLVKLFCRNDDGGPGYGKDSRLFFDPPADGEYQVRITDAGGQGGPRYAYRLTVRPPRPSFQIRFNPSAPAVWKGGAVPVAVTADRLDGYAGPINVRLENLPPGFSAPATSVPAGETTTSFALWADANAPKPAGAPLKLIARAVIDGKEVLRETTGDLPKLQEPGDLRTTTEQTEVTVKPGQEVRVTATIERRNGFTGRVPLEVRGLPHGVRVLNVGLNGILITEKETRRTFVIYCEPWVEPTEQPFVVLARREGKKTEHAAKSVVLRVVK